MLGITYRKKKIMIAYSLDCAALLDYVSICLLFLWIKCLDMDKFVILGFYLYTIYTHLYKLHL